MKWTVSAAKGVRKLSLRCSVIYPWAWSQAVTSFCIRKSFNGVDCDFSADTGPQSSFHRDNITTNTQPAGPLWRHDWRRAIKLNLLRQWETQWEYATSWHDFMVEKHKSTVLIFFFSLSHHVTITTQRKCKETEEEEERKHERLCTFSSGVIFTFSAAKWELSR